jgi:predicted transposase YbfD/YdcC
MKILEGLKRVKHHGFCKGRQYKIYSILFLSILAALCNRNTINSIERFGKMLDKEFLRSLGFMGKAPSRTSISNGLKLVDCDSLELFLKNLVFSDEKIEHIHIDGKVLKGSKSQGSKALHIVSAFSSDKMAVIAKEFVYEKENEIKSAIRLIEELDYKDAVITGDAIFMQQEIIQKISDKGCNFLMTVKGNQSGLKNDIKTAFDRKKRPVKEYEEEISKGHGRIEQRKIEVMDMPWEYLNAWKNIKQICRVTRKRSIKKDKQWHSTEEYVYLATSLTSSQKNAEDLLKINRLHWSVENKLHLIRDTVFDEDRHNLNKHISVHNFVSIKDFSIHILAQILNKSKEFNSYKAIRELFSYKPHLAIEFLNSA